MKVKSTVRGGTTNGLKTLNGRTAVKVKTGVRGGATNGLKTING